MYINKSYVGVTPEDQQKRDALSKTLKLFDEWVRDENRREVKEAADRRDAREKERQLEYDRNFFG